MVVVKPGQSLQTILNRTQTESDLFSLVGRQNEGEEGEQGDDGARDDEVERVVETEAPDADEERDVDVRVRTALVHHLVTVRRHFCVHHRSALTVKR